MPSTLNFKRCGTLIYSDYPLGRSMFSGSKISCFVPTTLDPFRVMPKAMKLMGTMLNVTVSHQVVLSAMLSAMLSRLLSRLLRRFFLLRNFFGSVFQ